MEYLMDRKIIPLLRERFALGTFIYKNLLVQGIGESFLSDRLEDALSPGDEVGARSLTTGEVRETITLGSAPVIDEIPMEPGIYECWFVAMDLHGKEYPSNRLTYEVTGAGETKIISITDQE